MQLLSGILKGAPVWVWPLLAFLVFIGIRHTRPRAMSVIAFYFLPLIGLITINTIVSLSHPKVTWTCYALGLYAGASYGFHLQQKWLLGKEGNKLHLAGEWFTFGVLMVMFWSNFIKGMTQALNPEFASSYVFVAIFAAVLGMCSGTFLGRSVRAIMYSRE